MTDNELRDIAHRVALSLLRADGTWPGIVKSLDPAEEVEVWRLVVTAQVIIGA